MRNEWKLKDAIGEAELACLPTKLRLYRWGTLRQYGEANIAPGALEAVQGA